MRFLVIVFSVLFCTPLIAVTPTVPTPYIQSPQIGYQLENQSFTLVARLPDKNIFWNSEETNPDYAYITAITWEVSTNGSSWRKIGTVTGDADLYTVEYALIINALKSKMHGWKYRATVDISYNKDQSKATTTTAPITLNIKPSFVKCPASLTFDAAGNLYVADMLTNSIWKITPANTASVFAGSATGEAGALNGSGTLARFNHPRGIAFQGGKFYIADSGNNAIRTITLEGTVSTLAGAPGRPGGYIEATGTNACFNQPTALTVDASGNVYVVDAGNNVIRKITPAGATSHIAGEPYATDLGLSGTLSMTSAGSLYTDLSGGIGLSGTMRMTDVIPVYGNTGTLTLWNTSTVAIAVSGTQSGSFGSNTSVFLSDTNFYSRGIISGGGLIFSGSSTLLISNTIHNTGTLFLSAWPTAEPAPENITETYYFHGALGITLSPDNQHLYVADSGNDKIATIALNDGKVTPLNISLQGVSGDPLANEYTKPTCPAGLRFHNNILYFADAYSSRIVKVTTTGSAQAIAGLSNWLWTNSLYGPQLSTIYPNSFEDGSANEALFNIPSDIAIDNTGNIYVADSENAAIRKITQSGTTVTVSTLVLQAPAPAPEPGAASDSDTTSGGGGGAPSTWFLLALGGLAALRLRRR